MLCWLFVGDKCPQRLEEGQATELDTGSLIQPKNLNYNMWPKCRLKHYIGLVIIISHLASLHSSICALQCKHQLIAMALR